MNQYTELSQEEFDKIKSGNMTASEAFGYLESGLSFRTFAETLLKYYKGDNLKGFLVQKMCEYNPGAVKDSVDKKVRGWLNGSYEPTDRETLLQICFALELDEENANEFLSYVSDGGFHYRNPKELAYAYALRTGLDYFEAVKLYESIPEIPNKNIIPGENDKVYTETVYNEFYRVKTLEQFYDFIKNNLSNMGCMHNTAYFYLNTFVKCLKDPDNGYSETFGKGDNWHDSEKLSIEAITEQYLRMKVPSGASKGKATNIEKIVKQYWPSVTSMKMMLSGTEDVKRKVLILLYIITEGLADDVNWMPVTEEDELSPEELFAEHFDRICTMLYDCGMSMPDPRNPFDWVALYAIKMNHEEAMSEELELILEKIFKMETNPTEKEEAMI